ncbi:glycosyltransferase family 2 protein [Microbacterium deminutum]|uniref:glycosyltransferase family 2 protein n=1 Tax=Microbacterium deminutum TaxID=344164 RepID=UPI0031D98E33
MPEDSGPRVSVVVRTKNRPEFLRRALESITGQSFTLWECIIVNDGGDPVPVDQLVERLPQDHRDRIRVLHSAGSRGRWTSANAGVLAGSAPLLVLHDDDDTWHPDFLASAVAYLDDNPDRVGVVSRIEIVWEEFADGEFTEVRREPFQAHLHDPLLSDTLLFNRFVPIAFVYRRALHEELGLYDERLPVVGDWAFNLRVLSLSALEFLGDKPLVSWHQRAGTAGAGGNSVIDARDDHAKFDARIRDEALREYVGEEGLGLVLYLTQFIDRRFVDIENGIRAEIREASTWHRAKDKLDRTVARALPRRRRR